MQELENIGDVIDGVTENINDDIFVLDYPQLVCRLCMYILLHFYFYR